MQTLEGCKDNYWDIVHSHTYQLRNSGGAV